MSKSANPNSSNDLVAEVIDKGQVSGQQVLVVGLCMFFNILDGFDITAMAVVAGAVSSELQLTPDRLGWIFSFALAGMVVGAMFLAPISDIIGRRKLIIVSIVLVIGEGRLNRNGAGNGHNTGAVILANVDPSPGGLRADKSDWCNSGFGQTSFTVNGAGSSTISYCSDEVTQNNPVRTYPITDFLQR